MLIKTKKSSDVSSSEITSETFYKQRRQFLKKSGQYAFAGLGFALTGCSDASQKKVVSNNAYQDVPQLAAPDWLKEKVASYQRSEFVTDEKLTPYNNVTQYNNFYEFGYDKTDPAKHAKGFVTDPWSVTIEGEVEKPGHYHLEDLLKPEAIEERIYRLRCVEAWSMVIPWVGFSLADMIKRW
ncbi:molybdopterin-dependent oxidoreductase [Endozoicomonas montiporae]|uniref:molybdopterin-dependent oxidoreductase n=1 Tax=Endozoicomonas montiporae TaxID=1027273 RepID=UPI00068D2FDA|nr:molybdopterin-dependent oxidoreductase [Endozoicomonas montiporae]